MSPYALRRLKSRFSARLQRHDLGAVKGLVRVLWPRFDTADIAVRFDLPEPLVATALARARDEDRRRG